MTSRSARRTGTIVSGSNEALRARQRMRYANTDRQVAASDAFRGSSQGGISGVTPRFWTRLKRREDRPQRVARVEQPRLGFLQILLIPGGNSLQRGEQRDQIAQHPACLAARQLEHVRISFLRHEAGPGTKGV